MIIGLFFLYIFLVSLIYSIFIGNPVIEMGLLISNNLHTITKIMIYLSPLFPASLRFPLIIKYNDYMSEVLSETERDSEAGRGITLAMTGFSCSAFFVLLATYPTFGDKNINIQESIYLMFLSILAFLTSFSMESYKHKRWQQQISITFEDMGKFCLLASVVALVWLLPLHGWLKVFITIVSLFTWLVECLYRIRIWRDHFKSKRRHGE